MHSNLRLYHRVQDIAIATAKLMNTVGSVNFLSSGIINDNNENRAAVFDTPTQQYVKSPIQI